MKKTTIFIVLIVLIGIAAFFAYQNLGGWVRMKAQQIASEAAGVNVSIAGIQVSWADRTIEIKGITVANPKGFSSSSAIKLGNIKATADVLSRDKIVIKDIIATGEEINLENDMDKINLRELLNGVQARASKSSPSPSSVNAPKVIISQLRIEPGALNSSINVLGKKTGGKLTIPQIRMSNLGNDKSNNNASEVAGKIIAEILNKSLQAAAQQGLLSKDGIKANVKDLKGSVKDLKAGLFGSKTK